MALWIAISGIEQKEPEELYFSNDVVRRCVPQDMVIEIGKSKFEGQLIEGDHIIMIDDSKFNETIDANKAYQKGYHAGETNGILTAKKKHYRGRTYDEIWEEAFEAGRDEGAEEFKKSLMTCLFRFTKGDGDDG